MNDTGIRKIAISIQCVGNKCDHCDWYRDETAEEEWPEHGWCRMFGERIEGDNLRCSKCLQAEIQEKPKGQCIGKVSFIFKDVDGKEMING